MPNQLLAGEQHAGSEAIMRDYGDLRGEYDALREGAGLIDLAHFGVLRVQGRDRAAWLHKLTTANIEPLEAGRGAYGMLLNATGHVVADFVVLAQADALLLYTSWSAKDKLAANLHRAIFREKVVIKDMSGSLALVSLQGPQAQTTGMFPALDPLQSAEIDGTLVVRYSRAGSDGLDLLVPRERVVTLWDALIARGARPVGLDALNVARVEAGIAWYGDDFDETMLAPEARLEPFIAENKGCYTGQEVIARIKNRGHVNRLLTHFEIEGDTVPARGDRVFDGEREVGWLTSAVWSFARNSPLALGYLRREKAEGGTRVQIAHGESRIMAVVV
ncbi:MAG: aminomethyl transferase family protein [Chloroflexi bacterium]|nr:aminomethyl transferase family protein [Chloroflexota bacterium]